MNPLPYGRGSEGARGCHPNRDRKGADPTPQPVAPLPHGRGSDLVGAAAKTPDARTGLQR